MKYLPVLLLFHLHNTGYSQEYKTSSISGKLDGFPENALVKLYASSGRVIDSCYLKQGQFILHRDHVTEPGIVGMTITKDSINSSTQLFLGNENVYMSGSKNDFRNNPKIVGSTNNDLMQKINSIISGVSEERSHLVAEYIKLKQAGKVSDSIWNKYWGPAGCIKMLDDEMKSRQHSFIGDHLNSYYGLYLLSVTKHEYDRVELEQLISRLKPGFRNSKYVYAINAYLKNKKLKPGDKYLDFTALDRSDRNVAFSNYFRGKNVLLEFSTPYCGFCLEAAIPLSKLKETNGDKLEIVTFYVDEEKNGYTNFLESSLKPWDVIWDQKGRFGDAYNLYHIYATPSFLLFDRNGILIQKEQGYNESFLAKIPELIN